MLRVWLVFCCTFAVSKPQTTVLRESTCSAGGQSAIIQDGAQAMIGGIIAMRRIGTNGYGCGDISTGSFIFYLFKILEEYILTKYEIINVSSNTSLWKPTNRLSELTGTMQSYEAIRWALDRLNKKNTVLNGEFLTDSYVPGVKLGKLHFT